MRNYTVDKCWKDDYSKTKGKKIAATVTQNHTEDSDSEVVHATFTAEQHRQLMEYLDKFQNQDLGQTSNYPGLAVSSQMDGNFCFLSNYQTAWILDSGATDHMCSDLTLFDSYAPLTYACPMITIPDGTKLQVKNRGLSS